MLYFDFPRKWFSLTGMPGYRIYGTYKSTNVYKVVLEDMLL